MTLSLKQRKNKTKQNKKCLPFHPKICCNLDGWHAFWKVVDVYCQIVSLTYLDTIFSSATKCFYKLNQTKYVMNLWEFWPIFFCRDKLFNSFAWEKSRHFATPSLVSPSNDVWGTSAEIPYWWRVTSQISVVLWLVEANDPLGTTNQSTYQMWLVTRHQYGISALFLQTW